MAARCWSKSRLRPCEARRASDGIVTIDSDSTILFANGGVGRIFGYGPDELLGTDLTRLMPEYLRHIHRAGMARYLETGVRHIHWAATELPGRHRDGHQIPLEISFGESRSGARHVFTGIIRDITSRKRAERRLAVENTVAQVLARSTSDEPVLVAVLGAAGAALAWPWGALWVRDKTADVMRCAEIWSGDPERYAEFGAISRLQSMARGEGLPGRVWLAGEPAWASDVVEERNFPRAVHAKAAGLHAGIAFPVQRRGEVQAIIEFLGDRVEEPDAELEPCRSGAVPHDGAGANHPSQNSGPRRRLQREWHSEGLAHWNDEFQRLGRRLRVDSGTMRPSSVPDALLRGAAGDVRFGRGPATTRLRHALEATSDDGVVILSGSDLIPMECRGALRHRGTPRFFFLTATDEQHLRERWPLRHERQRRGTSPP